MNEKDCKKLEKLDERFSPVNMTSFKLVRKDTAEDIVLSHIEGDLKILNSSDVQTRHVIRIIIRNDCIDICSEDNGTPVSYFFTEEANFTPQSLEAEVKKLCRKSDVDLDIII